jgi:hypothetical protein
MGGAGIAHPSMARLVSNPKTLAALDAVGCEDKKFCMSSLQYTVHYM